jgi:hypothetical protein
VQSVKVLEVVCCGCNSKTYFLDKDEKPAIDAWNKRASKIDCKAANKTPNGKCLGYQDSKGYIDDSPTKQCMDCHEYESYDDFHVDGYDD